MISARNTLMALQSDPQLFFKKILTIDSHWGKQIDIANSVRDNKFTVVKSAHGVGKTHISASICLWFLYCFQNAIVITTAPTSRQVEEILWKEIVTQRKPELGGELTHLRLRIDEGWEALGFTTRESADHEKMATRMQGFHAPHILIIFDEAPGVHGSFWTAARGLMTGEHSRFLAIGNPTSPSGAFFDAFKSSSFHKITVSAYEHPNVIQEKEIIKGAVTREWIEEVKQEWGEVSSLFQSRVLGEFPIEGDDTLILLSWIDKALSDNVRNNQATQLKKVIGVDVARFGSDTTVIVCQTGKVVKDIQWYNGKDLNWTLAKIKEIDEKYHSHAILIDDIGVGGGVTDGLRDYKRKSDGVDLTVIPVNVGNAPTKEYGNISFANLKAEMLWCLREDFRTENIKILDKGKLVSQLNSIKYGYTPRQQIKIVSKEDMKRQGLQSPDFVDALSLSNWGTKMTDISLYDDEESIKKQETLKTIGGALYSINF